MNKWLRVICASCIVFAALALRGAEITVFAAASLADALKQVARDYEAKTGNKVILSFGASSTLALQIEEGAPADVFLSADEAKVDDLEARGLTVPRSRRSILSNSLVIVVAADSPLRIDSPKDLLAPSVQGIALADPMVVPAGIYSKSYFQKLGVWGAVEPKVIATANVRAALAAVESGNADAGMVYKTDAAITKKVRVAFKVPAKDAPKISYPVVALKQSACLQQAMDFIHYLDSKSAKAAFERFGFIVLQQAPAS